MLTVYLGLYSKLAIILNEFLLKKGMIRLDDECKQNNVLKKTAFILNPHFMICTGMCLFESVSMLFNTFFTSVSGTDEDAILMLLTARSNDQRQQIKAAYKKAYGKVK